MRRRRKHERIHTRLQEAITISSCSTEPKAQAQWADFDFAGSEPTLEEFITWIAQKVDEKRKIGGISCNDGFRPVSFLLEATPEGAD